jgi:membrane associated rhomboid family serine protease
MSFHDSAADDLATKILDIPVPETDGSPIFQTDDEQEALACSLTLSAKRISHRCTKTAGNFILRVASNDVPEASSQLRAYLTENENWPPRPKKNVNGFSPLLQPPTLLLIGSMILLYTASGPWSGQSIWFQNGAGDARAILEQHQYYRLLTALCLHANVVHLLGNCLFGGFLFHFFCRLTGNGLGLFSMLLTATLANYINVFLHGTDHLFVGFSTAVFAIIGMLAMISRRHRGSTRYQRVLPFMAGAALLAMIGSSGEHTDLGAHFFGLCCGLLSGWILGGPLLTKLRKSLLFQSSLFIFSIVIIVSAWKTALS